MEAIPPDDIMEKYARLSHERQLATTNLMSSETYLVVCAHDEKGKDVSLDWQANQGMSIRLIMGVIMTGRSEFGRLWLEDLKKKISQVV